jgi:hypothetical protein
LSEHKACFPRDSKSAGKKIAKRITETNSGSCIMFVQQGRRKGQLIRISEDAKLNRKKIPHKQRFLTMVVDSNVTIPINNLRNFFNECQKSMMSWSQPTCSETNFSLF